MTTMFESTQHVVPQRTSMEALADSLISQGIDVVERDGTFWVSDGRAGFFRPLHKVWRLRGQDLKRPHWSSLAYVAVLASVDQSYANAKLGVHMLVDPHAFAIAKLPETRRRNLKKCRRLVEIGRLTDPELIARDGFAVHQSAMQRTGYGFSEYASPEGYREWMVRRASDLGRIVLVGLIDGQLVGYLEGWIVENRGFDTAYINTLTLHSDHLSSQVGTGLVVDFIEICKCLPTVAEIVYGYEVEGDSALERFKQGMGFPVFHLPSHIWMLGPGRHLVRRLMSHRYRQFTGDYS